MTKTCFPAEFFQKKTGKEAAVNLKPSTDFFRPITSHKTETYFDSRHVNEIELSASSDFEDLIAIYPAAAQTVTPVEEDKLRKNFSLFQSVLHRFLLCHINAVKTSE